MKSVLARSIEGRAARYNCTLPQCCRQELSDPSDKFLMQNQR
jgi:hypothetical protein